jgi:WD40 repeat protein
MVQRPISRVEANAVTASPESRSSFDDLLKQLARTPDEKDGGANVAPGVVFAGRFEIIRLLGRGGFGVVYQARDTELGRHVAIKLVRPDRLEEQAPASRTVLLDVFRREAEAAAKLNHPNIITIHDYGTQEGVPYLVLELLVGETLARRLQRGALPRPEAMAILAQICRGLQHAHAAGVIHRDLKPGNVFLREDGHVKILDFGLAHVTEALTASTGRQPFAGGTPGYMAPEQRRGGHEDERTDIFACGVILFELLCGGSPSDASERERMVGIPADLIAIAQRSLAVDPDDRYPSAQELGEALLQVAQRGGAALPDQPYRYLEQFTEADAPCFFGRERDVARLSQMLAARPFVALVGSSGAGKSSLVHAGLVPRLRRERTWTVVVMRPGGEPLQHLHERLVELCTEERVARLLPDADALVDAPGRAGRLLRAHARATATPILLVVDQLEELVTQVHTAAVRRAFSQAILSLADDAAAPIRVVATVRGDFLGKLTRNAELSEALAKNMVLLGAPDAAGLAETLRSPAALLGYEFEPGLVDEMVAAVADEAAPLPLLQLAASRLWERRDATRRRLSRAGLAAAGGVAGILAAHANQVLDGLAGRDEVTIARRILCELVTDEGTRRRVGREEVLTRFEDPGAAGRVLERLVSGRLVTSYRVERDEWVELAHESLIAGWTLLQGWLDEDRGDRQFRERLLAAATLWQERQKPRELLWRGETLDEALRWRRRYQGSISQAEQAFLSRSEARAHRARRVRRRLHIGGATVAIAVTLGSLFTVRAYRAAAQTARLREIMRTAGAAEDPLLGALILAEFSGQPEPPGGVAAAVQVAAQPIPLVEYRRHQASVTAGAFSREGKWVATGGSDGQVHVWRADGTGSPIVLKGHKDRINWVEFSPDSGRVLSSSEDKTARIWRADGTGAPIVFRQASWATFTPDGAHVTGTDADHAGGILLRTWQADGRGEPVVLRHDGAVLYWWEISPDGSQVLTAGPDGVGLWRAADGARIRFRPGEASHALLSADGSRILVKRKGGLQVWRADLTTLADLGEASGGLAFSPDGRRVVYRRGRGLGIVSADGTGSVMELSGAVVSDDTQIAFSPDGSRVLTFGAIFGADDLAHLWWADGTGDPIVLPGQGQVSHACFNHDGTRVLTVSHDRTARVWAVGDPPGVRFFRGHSERIDTIRVSPEGRLVATASHDGTARLWPVGGGSPVVLGKMGGPWFHSAAFSPDGTRVATASNDGVRVWPIGGGEPLSRPVDNGPISDVAFSPDGAWLAAVPYSRPETIVVRSDGSGEPMTLEGGGMQVSFSPDGTRLVAGGGLHQRVQVWRTDDWAAQPVVLQLSNAAIDQTVFHPRGSMILTGSWSNQVALFSLDGRELKDLRRPGGGAVAWSPDGELIASALKDGSVRISRLDQSGETVVLRGHQALVSSVAFTPDGRRLATASSDATARLRLIDWGELVRVLRGTTTACLTADQRVNYLDESPEEARAAWESCERRFGRAP